MHRLIIYPAIELIKQSYFLYFTQSIELPMVIFSLCFLFVEELLSRYTGVPLSILPIPKFGSFIRTQKVRISGPGRIVSRYEW